MGKKAKRVLPFYIVLQRVSSPFESTDGIKYAISRNIVEIIEIHVILRYGVGGDS